MKVLVVVDMQKDFLEPDGKLYLGKDTTEFKNRVAKRIREFDGVVVCTLDTHDKDSIEFKQFPPHCISGTEGRNLSTEIWGAFNDREGDLFISKSSFTGTEVVDTLMGLELSGCSFEFVGVCTHVCISEIIGALVNISKEKYNDLPDIVVRKDMVDDFNPEMAEMALRRMESLFSVKVV